MATETKQYTEIEFALTEDMVVTNDTVKVSVMIAVMINGDVTNENLSSVVRAALNKFIEGDWVFSNPTRQFDTGIEKAVFNAHIRIPASENYDLHRRAEKVNTKGIQLHSIIPDVSIPVYQMRAAESELRAKLLAAARSEADILSTAYGTPVTVHCVTYGNYDRSVSKSLRAGSYASSAATSASNAATSASFGGGVLDAIGNSERVAMTANITLRGPNVTLRALDAEH